jgi:hypothetical protein
MICEEDAYLRELVMSHIEQVCPSEGVGLEEKVGRKVRVNTFAVSRNLNGK